MHILFVVKSDKEHDGFFGILEGEISLVGTNGVSNSRLRFYIAAFTDKMTAHATANFLEESTTPGEFLEKVERMQKQEKKAITYRTVQNRLSRMTSEQLDCTVTIMNEDGESNPADFKIADDTIDTLDEGHPYFEELDLDNEDEDEDEGKASDDWNE